MASSKLSILKVKLNGSISWDSIIFNILKLNADDFYCVISEQSNEYISGYFLIFTMHNQTVFNLDNNKFETIQIKKQDFVKFDLFILSNKMLLWGNKRSADLFVTTLVQASNNELIVDSSKIDFIQTINNLLSAKNIRFSRMKITNVVIDEGIVANCSVFLASMDEPQAMVKKYMNCISQLTAVAGKESGTVSFTLYSNGSIVLSKSREDIDDETLDTISSVVGGDF